MTALYYSNADNKQRNEQKKTENNRNENHNHCINRRNEICNNVSALQTKITQIGKRNLKLLVTMEHNPPYSVTASAKRPMRNEKSKIHEIIEFRFEVAKCIQMQLENGFCFGWLCII